MATNENTKKRSYAENLAMNAKRVKPKSQEILLNANNELQQESGEKVGKQMAFWPDAVAAMPTELTRVALFGLPADKPGARKMFDAVKLESRSDFSVVYTGKQLCAKDETTWLACLRIGRGKPLGQRIPIDKAALLHEVGLTKTGPNWKTVEGRLKRLSTANLGITAKRDGATVVFTAGLLNFGYVVETDEMYIRLDPDGAPLFQNLAYQPWDVRLSLKTDMAILLLSYISGHEQGKRHAQPLLNLKLWCGYGGLLRKFRTPCLAALLELEAKGVLVKGSTKISGDVVYWTRERVRTLPAIAL